MDDDFWKGVVVMLGLMALGVLLICGIGGCLGQPFTWFAGQAVDVAKQELDPHVLRDRYNWFKDAAAVLDKKVADIKVYRHRFNNLEQAYAGKTRGEWPRDDREQWAIWASEEAGLKASYNQLAAEYNAAMAKEQWRFCEVGRLPPGATQPLPREFKPYQED